MSYRGGKSMTVTKDWQEKREWKTGLMEHPDPLNIMITNPSNKWRHIVDPKYLISVANESRQKDYYNSIKVICGEKTVVERYCAHIFQTDRCTPMYEHMLWRVGEVRYNDHTMYVKLMKTNYAGD